MKYMTIAAFLLTTMLIGTSTAAMAASKEQGSTNGQPFKALQERIDVVQMNLDEAIVILQNQIDELVDSQADQDTVIAAIELSLAALEARVSENEGDIAELQAVQLMQQQLIDVLTVQYHELELRVTDNEGDIADLINMDQVLQQLILNIQNQIVTINARIDANDNDIVNLQAQVNTLQLELNALQVELATKQDRITGYCGVGSSIRVINANGTVSCELDTVSAGVGSLSSYISSGQRTIPASFWTVQYVNLSRYCSGSGYKATGGGFYVSGSLGVGHIRQSRPYGNGWLAGVRSDSVVSSKTLITYVVCSRVVN